MDDFLHNLRTGKNKPFDRKRRTYENPHSRMQERQGNRNRRPNYQNRDMSNETLAAIRKVLDEISGNQKRLAEISNRRVAVEERKAEALEALVSHFQQKTALAGSMPVAAQAPPAPEPQVSAPATPDVAPAADTQVLSRPEIVARIKKHRKAGLSYEKVALKLEEEGVQTLSGRGRWRGQTIYRLAQEG
jgi:hypothetical protein